MTRPPNPWIVLAGTLLVGAAMVWSFLQGRSFERGAQALEEQKLAKVEARAAMATAREIAKIRIVNKTIYQEAQREVSSDPVYVDCRVPADGLQLLNAAIEGQALPTGGGGLPAPADPAR